MGDVVGSIRRVALGGTPFDVMADANISETPSKYANDAIATSGRTLRKMTARVQMREGLTVACNDVEAGILKALSERTTSYPLSYTTADGKVYVANGFIEFEKRETETGTATIKMFPDQDWSVMG